MLRLVYGLGTRAVNRVEDDYPRIIALDEPLVRPLDGMNDVRKYSQHRVDLLDTPKNTFRTISFQQLLDEKADLRLELVAVRDYQMARQAREKGRGNKEYWLLTFEKLLTETSFIQIMQNILKVLESHYKYPIDIEFTVNFTQDQKPLINLLQCRPLQTRGQQGQVEIPEQIDSEQILFSCEGHFMGGSICQDIKKVIYVYPKAYIDLPLSGKYDIARLVGELNRQITTKDAEPTILFGPGRWGTTTPSLGVPVSFHEINNITVLAEIAYEGGNLMPELSFGTHFFQDLVEGDIFYVALFPGKPGTVFSRAKFDKIPNGLTDVLPERSKYADVVGLYEMRNRKLRIISDITSRKVNCFFI